MGKRKDGWLLPEVGDSVPHVAADVPRGRLPWGLSELELLHGYGVRAAQVPLDREHRTSDPAGEGFDSPAVLQCRVGTARPGGDSGAGSISEGVA